MINDLKPCPFCGNKMASVRTYAGQLPYRAECYHCGAATGLWEEIQEAEAAWNKRVSIEDEDKKPETKQAFPEYHFDQSKYFLSNPNSGTTECINLASIDHVCFGEDYTQIYYKGGHSLVLRKDSVMKECPVDAFRDRWDMWMHGNARRMR